MNNAFVLEFDGKTLPFQLGPGVPEVRIGRSVTNGVHLADDRGVSKCHARIFLDRGATAIEDMGSRNGTFVNEAQVPAAQPLRAGDVIRIGNTNIVFRPAPAPTPAPAPERESRVLSSTAGMTCIIPVKEFEAQWAAVDTAAEQQDALVSEIQRLNILQQIASSLLDHNDLERLFYDCLDLIVSVVPARRSCLMMLENGALAVKAFRIPDAAPNTPSADILRFSNTVRRLVIEEKSAVLTANVEGDPQLEGAHSIIVQGIKSVMCVPLWNGDKIYGLIYLDSPFSEKAFNKNNLQLLTAVANLVTMKIENFLYIHELLKKKAMEKELEFAADVQKFLLQPTLPEIPHLETAVFYNSCKQLGGDYYHCLPLGGDRHLFLIADVMGKGTGAALLTASLHAYLSTYCERPIALADLIGCLNRSIATQCDGQIFVTLFALIVRLPDFEVEYCNAGHNEVILVRGDGAVEQLQEGGTLLGAMPDYPYASRSVILRPGDLLALYTDGVTEMEDPAGNMFGKERLIDLLVSHRGLACQDLSWRLLGELDAFRSGAEPHDDVTGILIRCR